MNSNTNTKSRSMDMVNGPLIKNIFIFAMPLMVTYLLQIAFNAADQMVVGKFCGEKALAAVGVCLPLVNLLVSLFNGLSTGANIIIAVQLGKNEKEGIRDAVHTSFFVALAGGAILTLLGFFLSGPLLRFMGTPEDIIDKSISYMIIYFLGSIPLTVYTFGAAILRAKGDTLRPAIYLSVAGVLNVILNILFVVGFKMDVEGVALATIISEALSAVLITILLIKENDEMKLFLNKIKPNPQHLASILKIGIPAGCQGMLWAVSNIAIQSSINIFGSVAVAGNSAAQNIENFCYVGMQSFSQGITTFTSQCAGAGEPKKIRKLLYVFSALTSAITFALGYMFYKFGPFFLGFFTDSPEVIEAGMIRMFYVVFFLWINALLDIPALSMRGMGYSTTPVIAMLLGIVGVRLIYIATVFQTYKTLNILYLCFPISWVIATIVLFLMWEIKFKDFNKKLAA